MVKYNKMPEIAINFDTEENKQIEIYKAEHQLKSKAKTVEAIVKEFFKQKKR